MASLTLLNPEVGPISRLKREQGIAMAHILQSRGRALLVGFKGSKRLQ